ncbi:exodeoxyribonuclease V subunit beta [Mycolicibacterium vaccae]|uniref:RecBCD enzyme subunit RecB n=1 Tax=Mycolicibacterium vaccae ATCC 25954 TaxID=1194972 RepID=K0VIT2_MYCVA|nr:exodeoxyribonuclease V subunit beta [Mycolicibacterium vaccae]ANI38249.1 exodeoxyribonuclease V subunit beta [Mycolicibacterium vaccae 95051]EJZ10969.1 exodeoxyribonuclease V subunit beta [Mycolicibacterium vaccae ATCC 25954]MCV7061196.1 exodeoxyribonuclease V subunit beta [Mycolicibacterium vaccae]
MTEPFDLLGPLPADKTTTVLEASAGTGKTFALAGLVTRYVAEGVATLDRMLLITFGRAASQELRERVRAQIVDAVRAFDDPAGAADNEIIDHLLKGTVEELAERRQRLRDALAGFDAATIATTHQFCQLVLRSLGVAGDTDSGVELVESLDDLVTEIVDDLYLAHFGQQRDEPLLTYDAALNLAREVVRNAHTELRPADPAPGFDPHVRVQFAQAVCAELETRKRRLGILHYDDLLSRLADALESPDSAARARMRQRWSIVMVDEFQDTDPVQWQVIDRAFSGHCTVILIGDPKQAIYAFRGGDIVTYLHAASTAGEQKTLGTNYRSDGPLVECLQAVMRDAQLGDPRIVVRPVEAHHRRHRLQGAPHNAPFRLRVVRRDQLGTRPDKTIPIDRLRRHIPKDLAADVASLLAGGATFCDRPLQPGDVAVIVESHRDGHACFDALTAAGIPAVYTGDSDVFSSPAADDWLCLLEAFDQPHRSGLVRAAATTMFFGETAETLAAHDDTLTDRIAETLRQWADFARERGVAAVFEAAQLGGMGERVLSWVDGERHMTDLAHLTQILHATAHREHFGLPALRDWLRTQREERNGAVERNRRLDSDAAAVQIMTVWVSKGLQFPVVYLPFAFNRNIQTRDVVTFHDGDVRCLHIGGELSPDHAAAQAQGRREAAGDDVRLTYVAMTRAQSQVVAWWAPSNDEPNGGLSRLLRGRRPGQDVVPDRCDPPRIDDADAMALLRAWSDAGGPVLEESVVAPPRTVELPAPPDDLDVRHFHRRIDTSWRRTSYSGLIRAAESDESGGVSSEPEVVELDDEAGEVPVRDAPAAGEQVPSPMADLPMGAKFGTLVHAVLETADPFAADLAAELESAITDHAVWWPVDVPPAELAAALVPMHDTPLGPLAPGVTLRDIGLRDRLREMEFEFPLAGGDRRADAPPISLADVGRLLARHLPAEDPLAPYADRLTGSVLAGQSLKGYLNGSLDAVLRVGGRYLVVDYKTNWLGDPARPLTAADYSPARLAEAMLHSDYPLQALLYCVVLHRFLRWRQPGYQPGEHLGGVLYLFVRGMCGPDTPVVDGHPAGVFSWQPPPALIEALSDLLDAGVAR